MKMLNHSPIKIKVITKVNVNINGAGIGKKAIMPFLVGSIALLMIFFIIQRNKKSLK